MDFSSRASSVREDRSLDRVGGDLAPRPHTKPLLESAKRENLMKTHHCMTMKRSAPLPVGGEGPLDVLPELRLPPDAALEEAAIQGDETTGELMSSDPGYSSPLRRIAIDLPVCVDFLLGRRVHAYIF